MIIQQTIPSIDYTTETLSEDLHYAVLDNDLKNEMLSQWGFMSPLLEDFDASCELAEDRFFCHPLGYVISFDPEMGRFVAFTTPPRVEIIEAIDQAMFDAIADEAATHEDTRVSMADGVAHIVSPCKITISVLAQ